MIASFRSKPLRRYWSKGEEKALRADWRGKVRIILSRLDVARNSAEMTLPGFGFHPLKGDQAGRFAVTVSHNWRITFAFQGEDAVDVDLDDYHGK